MRRPEFPFLKGIGIWCLLSGSTSADMVYLQTGEVLESVKIAGANPSVTTVSLNGQTRQINNKEILRTRYGQDLMEKVYIQTESDEVIEGFLIEQETDHVLIRRSKATIVEEKIPKSVINKMSGKKIVSYYPEIGIAAGYRIFLNSGGSALKPAFTPTLSYALHPPWFKNMILFGEVGFAEHQSSNQGQSLQVIPASLNALLFASPWSRIFGDSLKWSKRFVTGIRLGAGATMLRFTTGEGESINQLAFFFSAGAIEEFAITAGTTLALEVRYEGIMDKSALLHSIVPAFQLRYRY